MAADAKNAPSKPIPSKKMMESPSKSQRTGSNPGSTKRK